MVQKWLVGMRVQGRGHSLGFRLVILVLLFLWLVLPVHAGTETLITTSTSGSDQSFPAISGNWIVWMDTRHEDGLGYKDIYA